MERGTFMNVAALELNYTYSAQRSFELPSIVES